MKKGIATLTLINNRKGTGTAKKASPVELRVTYCGKQKYLSTGVKVTTSEWDRVNGKVKRRADAVQLNKLLYDFKDRVMQVVMELYNQNALDLSTLGEYLNHKDSGASFLDFVEKRIGERKDVAAGTTRRWKAWLNQMRQWGKIKSFRDVTRDNVYALDSYLHERGLKQSTVCGYHKNLKLFIGEAIKKGFLHENPYQKYDIQISRGDPCTERFLTDQEVECIAEVKLPDGKIDEARDLFMFQCLTGISYKDLSTFHPEWVEHDDKGTWVYTLFSSGAPPKTDFGFLWD